MSAQTALARGRGAAEALMVDACTVKHQTGTASDDTTGVVTPTYSTVYSGRCKLQRPRTGDRRDNVGEAGLVVTPVELHLPVASSTGISSGDLVTVTTATWDADLTGKTFRVVGPAAGSLKTARRLEITEVTS